MRSIGVSQDRDEVELKPAAPPGSPPGRSRGRRRDGVGNIEASEGNQFSQRRSRFAPEVLGSGLAREYRCRPLGSDSRGAYSVRMSP